MRYRVVLTRRAERDIQSIHRYILNDSVSGAERWIDLLEQALTSLELLPHSHPIAPENIFFPDEIRHHLFGRSRRRYRIIYKIEARRVVVLHIRHGARLPWNPHSQ